MKLLSLFTCFIILISCKDNDEVFPLTNIQTFNLSSEEQSLCIEVQSKSKWKVEGDTTWCKMRYSYGQQKDSLFIHVAVNLMEKDREVVWKISDDIQTEDIQIRQAAATEEYHYKLPTVFHIFSYDEGMRDDKLEDRLLSLLEQTNKFFGGENRKKIDINVEFVPVTCTPPPFNTPLSRPGIHWQYREVPYNIDAHEFIDNVYGDAKYLWDPNKYVNIYIYKFKHALDGVSALPWTPENNPLEGLLAEDRFYYEFPDDFIPSVNINLNHMYKEKDRPDCPTDKGVATLTHELGHYLGLYHAFEEDFCNDTPEYDRDVYEYSAYTPNKPWEEIIQRTALDGHVFISTNFEDYEFGYYDEITPDQRKRIRHVLNYSPMIPGPKIPIKLNLKSKSTKSTIHGLIR